LEPLMTLAASSDPNTAPVTPARTDFMAASPYPHIAYTLEMVVLDLNWRYARMTGVPREAAVGRDIYDVFPPNPNKLEADARPAVAASLERMVATREPDVMPIVKYDLPAPAGGFQDRYWQIVHSPIFEGPDDTGAIVGALQTTRDFTAEVARRKIEAAQRRAAHGGGKLVFFELDLTTDEVGPSGPVDALHGFEPGHPERHVSNYFARIHADDRDQALTAVEALRDAPDTAEGNAEYRIVQPDGSIRWATARFEVVRGIEGEPPKITGMVLDVTDLRRREVELQEAVEARDMLLAEVNHRIKNSLQLVASMLNIEAADAEQASETGAGRLQAAAMRVGAIATVHAALYHGKNLRSVEFGVLLHTLCRHLAETTGAAARGIALVVKAETICLATDRAITLSLIVNELVADAFEHTFPDGRGGTVRVTLRRESDDRIALEVADDGTGAVEPSSNGTRSGGGALGVTNSDPHGLGRRMIVALANQLDAEVRWDENGAGARVRLEIPHRDEPSDRGG
jgi:two-component sensor histidine kinase